MDSLSAALASGPAGVTGSNLTWVIVVGVVAFVSATFQS